MTALRFFGLVIASMCAALSASAQGDAPDAVLLRVAVLGDAEPKPEPVFPGLTQAVEHVNRLAAGGRIDFVIGVGDIAHKGTLVQYEAATEVLRRLERPLYPIMGNEEHGSTVERFLEFAGRWNAGRLTFTSPRYVVETEHVDFVFASPDFARDFNDDGLAWILAELRQRAGRPVMLVVHGAQVGVFPDRADKGVTHPGFAEVVAQPNLVAVICGDLHMDMERVHHSRQIGHVHYLHIPGLERTKVPDETRHVPMFRVLTLHSNRRVVVDTYRAGSSTPLPQHAYGFALPAPDSASGR